MAAQGLARSRVAPEIMRSMDQTLKARALIQSLSRAELEALRNIAAGRSLHDLQARLSIGRFEAAEILHSMKRKLGVTRDADAVRVAIEAGLVA